MKKEYEGNPNTGRIIVRGDRGKFDPKLVEAMNAICAHTNSITYYTNEWHSHSFWDFTGPNFIKVGKILHSFGYLPAIRD